MSAKTLIYSAFTNRKFVCLALFTLALASLTSAYMAEYVYGLKPCILCLYQRAPYFAVLGLSLIGFLFTCKENTTTANIILLCAFIFLCGSAIAFYHSGVELKWWKSFLEKCAADFNFDDPEAYLAKLQETEAVRCDEIPWSDPIFNLSMANYNTFFSFMYAIVTATSGLMIRKTYKVKK